MMTRHKPLPNGSRAIMGSAKKRRGRDKLQLFCTPPFATRALCEVVIPHVHNLDNTAFTLECLGNLGVWEPACGEGHMSEVLKEYFGAVQATDIHFYGDHQDGHLDFLSGNSPVAWNWIISNPPFGPLTQKFVVHALQQAQDGVAMFVRSQWAVEGVQRYNELFSKTPPTLMAFFSERVPLCKGRWDPDGTTATAYCWLVWVKGREPMAPFWIPPGQRKSLERPDDRARFAAWSLPQKEAAE